MRIKAFYLIPLAVLFVSTCPAQTAGLAGHVLDQSGASVSAAAVEARGPSGLHRTTTSGSDGAYSFDALPPGAWSVTATANQLGMPVPQRITLRAGRETLDLRLAVAAVEQRMTVDDSSGPETTTDPSGNASATVLSGDDLQSLADDPEDLQADLEALAGPSAGPGGNQILIDGFTTGGLPPKESIREVRVNQNPFSPEFDKLGIGRVEIFTKPGTDKFHGSLTYNYAGDWWNSRNPYAPQKAPLLLNEFENSFSGPLTKRSSFTLDLERHAVNNGSIINASLPAGPFSAIHVSPQHRFRISSRVDYQINDHNYLAVRYQTMITDVRGAGIGGSNLETMGRREQNTFNTLQAIETSLHGTTVNETRFQYYRWNNESTANNPGPTVFVLGAFNEGGAVAGHTINRQRNYELHNTTYIVHGTHSMRFGGRLRGQTVRNLSPDNFGGTFIFSGLAQYALGQASQFSISSGLSDLAVSQFDLAAFAGDDWRIKPNLTLSYGYRLESQTNVPNHFNSAPRIGLAWSPGKQSKTVVRAGVGLFYDRFDLFNTLNLNLFDGVSQKRYVANSQIFYPAIPSLALIGVSRQQLDPNFHIPYLMQSVFTLERQLPRKSTVAATYSNAHALHSLRTANINTPVGGVYPYPGGPILQMSTSGRFNQNQLIVNLNSRISSSISFFSSYVLNHAMSDTDGLGSYPGNPFNYSGEYGPASSDVRHRFQLGGSLTTRWNFRFNPNISFQSGAPFDLLAGTDPFNTSVFATRPGINPAPGKQGLIQTPYGLLDPNPVAGETMIGRNAGRGPGQAQVNLRVAKIWGLGRETGGGKGKPVTRRYSLSVGLSARNLLNHTNAGPIIGNINSPLFGRSNRISGGPNGEGFSENANNRRLESQLRFSF